MQICKLTPTKTYKAASAYQSQSSRPLNQAKHKLTDPKHWSSFSLSQPHSSTGTGEHTTSAKPCWTYHSLISRRKPLHKQPRTDPEQPCRASNTEMETKTAHQLTKNAQPEGSRMLAMSQ
jgi:hypothetical protein